MPGARQADGPTARTSAAPAGAYTDRRLNVRAAGALLDRGDVGIHVEQLGDERPTGNRAAGEPPEPRPWRAAAAGEHLSADCKTGGS
jgi:hypothetical protein